MRVGGCLHESWAVAAARMSFCVDMLYLLFLHVALSGQALMFNAYSVKKKKKKDFFLFILKALLRSAVGFASGGVKCHRRTFPLAAFLGLNEKMASTLSHTSHLQRPLPKCVFPPVDNWAVISVKQPLIFLAFIEKQPRVLLRR